MKAVFSIDSLQGLLQLNLQSIEGLLQQLINIFLKYIQNLLRNAARIICSGRLNISLRCGGRIRCTSLNIFASRGSCDVDKHAIVFTGKSYESCSFFLLFNSSVNNVMHRKSHQNITYLVLLH